MSEETRLLKGLARKAPPKRGGDENPNLRESQSAQGVFAGESTARHKEAAVCLPLAARRPKANFPYRLPALTVSRAQL